MSAQGQQISSSPLTNGLNARFKEDFHLKKKHFFGNVAFSNDWPQNPKKLSAQGNIPIQYLNEDMLEFFLGEFRCEILRPEWGTSANVDKHISQKL